MSATMIRWCSNSAASATRPCRPARSPGAAGPMCSTTCSTTAICGRAPCGETDRRLRPLRASGRVRVPLAACQASPSMLFNKRRTPFGWRADVTKKLQNVEWGGASYRYVRILPASRIDLDRQTPMFLPYDLRAASDATKSFSSGGLPKRRPPFVRSGRAKPDTLLSVGCSKT